MQRYDTAYDKPFKDDNGPYVLAADAEAAITAAEQRGYDRGVTDIADMALPAIALSIKRDALARCIAAVEASPLMEGEGRTRAAALAALRGLGVDR